MTYLLAVQRQYRHPLVEAFAIQRIFINIAHLDLEVMFVAQLLQRDEHVIAKMAPGTSVKNESWLTYPAAP